MLCKKFKKIEWGKKSEKYNYWCDFYIEDIDTWIEYQGFWTHGDHPFNPNDEKDIERLNFLNSRKNNSKLYQAAIDVWMIKDPLKRETAKNNNLNYIEFWNINEVKEWLNNF